MMPLLCFFIAFYLTSVVALRLEQVEEGACPRNGFQPLSHRDWIFVNSFTYIPAGSRHDLYAIASSHPRFKQMREYELRNGMCLTHNATLPLGLGNPIGFGRRVLGTYYFGPRPDESGVFDLSLVSTARKFPPLQVGSETITLTDYKTFVFMANCFVVNASEQKSWKVLSLNPTLSHSTRKAITNHAVSLGFKRENFVFLNYDLCGVSKKSSTDTEREKQTKKNPHYGHH